MAQYLIHACPKRMWYVEEYLVPSLLKQGIKEDQIRIYNDTAKDGNLRACMKAFESCGGDGGTWHIQDDVCICHDFKERTEEYDYGIVCGFSSLLYDGDTLDKQGVVHRRKMWFSFPCIRIPNVVARGCAEWVMNFIIGNPVYEKFWKSGVNDDWAFRLYLQEFYPDVTALNIMPNLVDHVDYLLGGGTGVKERNKPCRSQYWKDEDIVKVLEEQINGLAGF